jgi:hypothetical protein
VPGAVASVTSATAQPTSAPGFESALPLLLTILGLKPAEARP